MELEFVVQEEGDNLMLMHRSSVSRSLEVLCTATLVALLGFGVGCSKDDLVGDSTAEAVEAGLNDVLTSTVDPLFSFLGAVPVFVGGGVPLRSSFGGLVCPDTGSVCAAGGSAACTVTGGGFSLTFDFVQCGVVTGDGGFTLDGGLVVTPGISILLSLNNLFINNSPAMTGTGTVAIAGCSYVVNVSTDDPASVFGTIIQCDTDNYPTAASNLTISLNDFLIDISFDGSSVASAIATRGGSVVADCSINLAADPLSSSCSAP